MALSVAIWQCSGESRAGTFILGHNTLSSASLVGSLLKVAGRASMLAEARRDEQTTALPTGSGSARRLR